MQNAKCIMQNVPKQDGEDPKRGVSSAGRAPALQAGGHRFDPGTLHQQKWRETEYGPIAQLARAHDW